MAQGLVESQRENWGSRAGFVLAAIGSAVGLGNLWGFPYKVYDNGGGAFLVPYLIAMVLIGIPVLILEFSLGHMTQRAAPDAYRGINRKSEPVGWWGILLGFVIITYYPVILAYCASYLIECVSGIAYHGGELAWKGQGLSGVKEHFSQYLNAWTQADAEAGVKPWALGGLVTPVVASLIVVWGLMYLCICRGVKTLSRVVLLTVPLPWIMLLILTVRGLTLPGAARGLNFYLDPNWSELAKPETWRWAFGQMFFSMSLAFGVMVTYASFLHRKSDLNNNATIIGLADIGTSFVAGIAVFATLGAMSFATGQAGQAVGVTEVVSGGPGLAFVAFPYALAQLPYSAWFGAVFFVALLTLGIDSAFSITESVLASLVDKTGWKRGRTLIGLSVVGLGSGLVYCTRGGLSWLGSIDDFINSGWGGIALLGLLQCVVVGWAYRIKRLREHANERSDWRLGAWWDIVIRYVAPLLLSTLFAWSLVEKASSPGGFIYDAAGQLQLPALVGLVLAGLAPILAIVLSCIHSPGADAHAQHVGQPRTGRTAGVVGIVVVVAAFAVAVILFRHIVANRPSWIESASKLGGAIPWVKVHVAGLAISSPVLALCIAAFLAIYATIIGAVVVARAERGSRRPSGLARFAAGAGVIATGTVAGLALTLMAASHEVREKFESVMAAAAKVEAATPAASLDHLTGPSYVVVSVMLAMLVVGLGWCFYRAIKAAGGPAEQQEQRPEGMDA